MTIEEFKTRCNEEFKAKKKGKWTASIVLIVLGLLLVAWNIINLIIVLSSGYEFRINFGPIVFILLLFAISGTLTNERDKVIKKYKKSGEYQSFPVDYPYSILYPGESWPFGQTNMQPNMQTNMQPDYRSAYSNPSPAPVAPAPVAPAPAPVAPAPTPESVVITCEKCGQQMLIPSGSGTVKLTCPKCGSDIIHTYSN